MTQVQGAVEVSLESISPEQLRPVVTAAGWARLGAALQAGHAGLQDRTVWMVNSTAVGGGVAELLRGCCPTGSGPSWMCAGRWSRPDRHSSGSRNGFTTASRASRRRGGARGAGAPRLRGLAGAERRIAEAPGSCGRHRGPPRPADRGPGSGTEGKRRERRLPVACRRRPPQRARPGGLGLPACHTRSEADAIVFTRRSSAPPWLGARGWRSSLPPSIRARRRTGPWTTPLRGRS